ncbi:MopE-related protein [Sorangium sp. So ce1014]|uniref:MopE-related protein n=1 Tax=Sorangium sp. So ce1014 TaxID=3133326 RepID=UPI003F60886F
MKPGSSAWVGEACPRSPGIRRSLFALGAWAAFGALVGACGRTSLLELSDAGAGGAGVGGGLVSTTSASSNGGDGAGGFAACGGPTDCDDGDACTSDDCEDGRCEHRPRDDDRDGLGPTICGGSDCNDFNPSVFPGAPEICTDAADNDCNGVGDCFDPACAAGQDCGCTPSHAGERCENGVDDDCDTLVDCFDADCSGTPVCGCSASEIGKCGNGVDDDCDGVFDCDDGNCGADPLCACSLQGELCDNRADDDCDLLVDCADPDCRNFFPCVCEPPGSLERCEDGQDNDCDGRIDCADPQCISAPACDRCVPEICDDGFDNDCDEHIDCADAACVFAPNCEPTPEQCNNELDDDRDALIDCRDPDCASSPVCVLAQANCLSPRRIGGTGTYTGDTTGHVSETLGACGGDAGEAVFFFVLTTPSRVRLDSRGSSFDSVLYVRTGICNAGREIGCDDDSGGESGSSLLDFSILYPGTYFVFLDGYTIDPGSGANEGPFVLNVEIVPNPSERCDDDLDNDGDHHVDCADPDCAAFGPCRGCANGAAPGPEFGSAACTDGIDNDCDGTLDCADEDCSASDFYVTECCDGLDENGNGIPDDFNCRCASDADCDAGQICYAHTAYTCGLPCNSFFGSVCPFVAPGSHCNDATSQCEF